MGCIKVIVRHLVGMLAFFTWLTGTLIIAVCLWTIATASNFNQLIDGKLPVTYFTLGFGGLLFLNGLLGWTGASKKNNILLKLFMVLSFLILIAEIGAILTISIFKANSGQLIDQTWQELSTKSHYLIQEQLTCCGLSGPSDYESSRDIDQSCYHREPLLPNNIDAQPGNLVIREETPASLSGFSSRLQSNRILNNIGCRQKISDWFFDNRLLILAFCGSLLLYQIITMLLTSAAISFSRRRRHDSLEELETGSNHHLHHHGATYM